MALLKDVITKISNIDNAIENALKQECAEVVRNAIVESARQNVYDVYMPKFESRRNGNGGILDSESIKVIVKGNELVAYDTLPGVKGKKGWQQRWGGDVPSGRLAEAIATGDTRYNMGNAGPRPFHEKAKEEIIANGVLEDALRRGLARQGIDASNLTFKFI